MIEEAFAHLNVLPLAGALGAEILDVDLKRMDEAVFGEVERAFKDYGVIFFRDQILTPEEHIAFAHRWGEINVNRFFRALDSHPAICEVRKDPHNAANIGGGWHTDHSYDDIPAMGSVLYALEVPPHGGDTLFSSMSAAYDALSSGMKRMLHGLNAVHSSRHVFGPERYENDDEFNGRLGNPELATQDAVHPVVIRHPLSGRACLYVNPGFTVGIEGWTEEESAPLLEYLYQHAARPEFTCRFRWREGSVAFWDNRATWHYALNDYPGERRLMHRITLEGTSLHRAQSLS